MFFSHLNHFTSKINNQKRKYFWSHLSHRNVSTFFCMSFSKKMGRTEQFPFQSITLPLKSSPRHKTSPCRKELGRHLLVFIGSNNIIWPQATMKLTRCAKRPFVLLNKICRHLIAYNPGQVCNNRGFFLITFYNNFKKQVGKGP